MTNNLYILVITVFLIMCCFVYLKWQTDKQFGTWLLEIKKLASIRGLPEDWLIDFVELELWDLYLSDHTPEEALELYILQHQK